MPLWEPERMEKAIDSFWKLFGKGRSDLRGFAISQSSTLPPRFTYQFVNNLDQVGWTLGSDPQYELAMNIMGSLAEAFSKGPGLEDTFGVMETQLDEIRRKSEEKQAAEVEVKSEGNLKRSKLRKNTATAKKMADEKKKRESESEKQVGTREEEDSKGEKSDG